MNFIELCKKISISKYFENFITFVIILAGILIGIQTNPQLRDSPIINMLDQLILWIFVVEIIIKLLSDYPKSYRYFFDGWHIFDFIIVAVCFLPYFIPNAHTEYLAILRMARILRLVKLFEKISKLKILLNSLMRSLPSITYVVAMLLMLFYIYGVLATDLFGQYDSESAFSNVFKSMLQLFWVSFEGWSGIMEDKGIINSGVSPFVVSIFFISFSLLAVLIFLNLFIGIITSELADIKEEEKSSHQHYFKSNHTLILGWSQQIFKVVEELIEANESQDRAYILILAEMNNTDMQMSIKNRIKDFKTTHITFRQGSPLDLIKLKSVNPFKAKSIIVLTDEENDNSDYYVIKTCLALSSEYQQENSNSDDLFKKINLVADFSNKKYMTTVEEITENQASLLFSNDLIARLMAHTCLQPGLSEVYHELFSFKGNEIYLWQDKKSIVPKASHFAQICKMFSFSTVIGYRNKFNQIFLNPKSDEIWDNENELIIVSEDDSTIKINSNYQEGRIRITNTSGIHKNSNMNEIRRVLILGWNQKGSIIVEELAGLLNNQVEIFVYTNLEKDEDEIIPLLNQNIKIQYSYKTDITSKSSIEEMDIGSFHHVIILSEFDNLNNIQKADSDTLITLVHLRSIKKALNNTANDFSILSELLDVNNVELARVSKANDYIISSFIKGGILAQLSESRHLKDVYNDLFATDKPNIVLKDVSEFLDTKDYSFSELIDKVFSKNNTFLGFIINGKMIINPNKTIDYSLNYYDKLIVLNNSYLEIDPTGRKIYSKPNRIPIKSIISDTRDLDWKTLNQIIEQQGQKILAIEANDNLIVNPSPSVELSEDIHVITQNLN